MFVHFQCGARSVLQCTVTDIHENMRGSSLEKGKMAEFILSGFFKSRTKNITTLIRKEVMTT